jgi:hypothetical protein
MSYAEDDILSDATLADWYSYTKSKSRLDFEVVILGNLALDDAVGGIEVDDTLREALHDLAGRAQIAYDDSKFKKEQEAEAQKLRDVGIEEPS